MGRGDVKLILDREGLLRRLAYDSATGIFTWKKVPGQGGGIRAVRAGNISLRGYREIRVDGKLWKAHRLAWLIVHGEFPPIGQEPDHINGDRDDNRISNLRLATRSQNNANQLVKPGRRFKGAYLEAWTGRWLAKLGVGGKSLNLGRYDTEEDAARTRDRAAIQHFGEFARLNFPRADYGI